MSDHKKGVRRPKNDGKKFALRDSLTLGSTKVKTELVITILMAVVYAALQLGSALSENKAAMIMTELLFLIFLVLAYLARTDVIAGLKKYEYIMYIFLGLSVVTLLWRLLTTYIIADTNSFGNVSWVLIVGGFNAIVSLIIIAALIYIESIPLDKIFVKVGDSKGIIMGIVGFILCLLFAIVGAFLLSSGISLGRLEELIGVVLVFGIACGFYEELWFRGLLLSKVVPILGESSGNIFQAIVFGIFEAMVLLALIKSSPMMIVFFVLIGAMVGFYWGRATLKTGSLLSSALLHAGLYILILLPLLASSLT